MSGMEVAMAIPYFAFLHSLMEQAAVAVDEILGIAFDSLIFRWRDGNANIFLSLIEILISVLANNV